MHVIVKHKQSIIYCPTATAVNKNTHTHNIEIGDDVVIPLKLLGSLFIIFFGLARTALLEELRVKELHSCKQRQV